MNKKLLFLICLILFIFTVSSVSAADDLNQTIDEDVFIVGEGTFSELQEIISNAQSGSTVNLDKDYVYDEDNGFKGIIISNKEIIINGNGHTLDGNHTTRIFDILNQANVVLNDISFVNGKSYEGGAIYGYTNTIKINNCSFVNNAADEGGAIYSSYQDLVINDCSFINNNANEGGSLLIYDSTLSISDSLFLNNTGEGAAINFVHEYFGSFLISNSVFNNNVGVEHLWINLIDDSEYTDGIVHLSSSDNLADNQISLIYYMDEVPFPDVTFSNVSYNGFENQSFKITKAEYNELNSNSYNKTIRFEIYCDDELLINTTNTTVDGIARIDYGNLTGDNFYLKAYYANLMDSAKLKIKKDPNFTMSVDDIIIGEDVVIFFNISSEIENYDNATATVEIYDTGVYHDLPKYFARFNLKDKNITLESFPYIGNFGVILYFGGDESFFSQIIEENFNIFNVDYNLTGNRTVLKADSIYKKYGDGKRLNVNLTDENNIPLTNKEISIEINGVTYIRTTDEMGCASIAINLPVGYYRPVIGFGGDDKYLPIKYISEIMIYSTIDCPDISKYVGVPTVYTITCYDCEGNKLTEGDVEFNINGVIYHRQIDDLGFVGLTINLHQGTYIITAKNPATGEVSSGEITVLPSIVNNYDLVKYYRNDSQFTVTLDGPFVLNDQLVTFNINGVMYERKTNDSGIAKLNINLSPGEYIITSMFKGCMVSNKITVLPILNATDLKMTYLGGKTFNASLVDGLGSPLKGESITFNVNGVFYERTTNENGVAKLNINLMKGEYIITSSYNGCNIANKITIV